MLQFVCILVPSLIFYLTIANIIINEKSYKFKFRFHKLSSMMFCSNYLKNNYLKKFKSQARLLVISLFLNLRIFAYIQKYDGIIYNP